MRADGDVYVLLHPRETDYILEPVAQEVDTLLCPYREPGGARPDVRRKQ